MLQQENTQGILHSSSSPLNQPHFFPSQCNWEALVSASENGKTDWALSLLSPALPSPICILENCLLRHQPHTCSAGQFKPTTKNHNTLVDDWVPSNFCRLPLLRRSAPTALISTAENNRQRNRLKPVPGVHPLQWYKLKVVILKAWSLHSANALATLELSTKCTVKADLQCKPCRNSYWLLILHF